MNKLEYPYYNLEYQFKKRDYKNKVKKFEPIIIKKVPYKFKNMKLERFDNDYFFIKEDYLKSYEINSLTDYFTEPVRIKCKFGNYLSPFDYWKKNKKGVIEDAKRRYGGVVSIKNLREIIYLNTKLCNNFRITVALTVLNYFKPKKWLDISAGWGDRLISAILYDIKLYVSCDPNLELHPYYEKIIETLVPKSKQKNFIIYKNGFIEAPIPSNKKFDIVFSSPPFFTLEKYSTFNENSITKYSNKHRWETHFFIPALIKAYNHLEKDGHMVLYMGGCEDIMHRLDKIMDYRGIIYFYENNPRAMYVWRKRDDDIILRL